MDERDNLVYICSGSKGWGHYSRHQQQPSELVCALMNDFKDLVYVFGTNPGLPDKKQQRGDTVVFVDAKDLIIYNIDRIRPGHSCSILHLDRSVEKEVLEQLVGGWWHYEKDFDDAYDCLLVPIGPLVIVMHEGLKTQNGSPLVEKYARIASRFGRDVYVFNERTSEERLNEESEWLDLDWRQED
jgi:hypothetical protein